jgi:peptide/nickel transport system substrate-binding protein
MVIRNWRKSGSPAQLLACALVALTAMAAGGCGRARSQADGDARAVTILIEAAPTNLDPRIGTDAQSQHIDALIFSSLLARDAQMNIVGDLAERWEMPDARTYVFHLRRGVKFHDGRPCEAADVKYTFDTILAGPLKTAKRGAFRMVTSVEAPDAQTVVFRLSEPYASFLWNLTRPGVGIVPRGATAAEMVAHPIGTGPFRFVSSEMDEEIVLQRNTEYFGDALGNGLDDKNASTDSSNSMAPAAASDGRFARAEAGNPQPRNIERVRLRIVPDAITRALELQKGTADGEINTLTPDMYAAMGKMSGIAVAEEPGTPMQYIAFNCDDKILGQREVRQALAYATDRATLIKYLLHGQGRAASSLLPPNHWAYDGNVNQYDYDPKRAEELLDSAGLRRGPDGVRFHVTLKTSTDAGSRLLGEALADEWSRVGVALELRSLEYATFYSDITRGSFQLYTQRWVGGNNDPDIFQYVFSSKKMPPDGANRGHYRNPELDKLLDAEGVEMDQAKRKALLAKIQEIVAEDEAYLNLWYVDNMSAHRTRMSNVEIGSNGDYDFLNRVFVSGTAGDRR